MRTEEWRRAWDAALARVAEAVDDWRFTARFQSHSEEAYQQHQEAEQELTSACGALAHLKELHNRFPAQEEEEDAGTPQPGRQAEKREEQR